ncbi:Uncharacterized conserved protein YdeI, YjbR/CyaY-like superfamily, DUF1801 family [Bizionia echini]|uniref:Uncharacterized conserved protein YdeI, YjbR/CyaY-like superfamily, DUF1801 family n=1 Tax=Bizionia echini TaxID=649333 RepID=A0A1I5BDV4_9FLAO|nr:DUF1801 domain-containing protein [Bizionia echini]SFN72850.1 Uncharacterized conserved protein YdeI, YjbR/CyaY-like superfamily, DUF1801 family [Bizionia echini]
MKKVNSVEEYLEVHAHFSKELELLRNIILKTDLEESIKWNAPVYSWQGKNILGLGAFKHHFGIWFFNGVFLKDEQNLLEKAQEKTKALRQMRFKSGRDIHADAVLSYVKEAINNQKEGKELQPVKKEKTIQLPKELTDYLNSHKEMKLAFKKLTPGKQREYSEYIDSAKRDTTKSTRLKKIHPMVLEGIGLHDKYKNC